MTYFFDHLVFIARDKINLFFHFFLKMGFKLSNRYEHNLGSSNHLIILEDSYLEILGWESGSLPKRQEIANLSIGIDALVFRTEDAFLCHSDLIQRGFSPNPVQELSRPAVVDGRIEKALFRTVRFAKQPIPGLRIYFCEHCTPDFVWVEKERVHPNQIKRLEAVHIFSADPKPMAESLANILNLKYEIVGMDFSITLPNCRLNIYKDQSADIPYISSCVLVDDASQTKILIQKKELDAIL